MDLHVECKSKGLHSPYMSVTLKLSVTRNFANNTVTSSKFNKERLKKQIFWSHSTKCSFLLTVVKVSQMHFK